MYMTTGNTRLTIANATFESNSAIWDQYISEQKGLGETPARLSL